jgi:DNA repair exonuclease SbcCD ATPase subunit
LIIAITCIVAIAVIAFVLGVRPKDLPAPEPVSPFAHLDERKAAIYENLRDLQFEFRVGKLSDEDYQHTKKDLQKELAAVMAEVDQLKERLGQAKPAPARKAEAPKSHAAAQPQTAPSGFTCPACGASFEQELKFCGECGKPMKAVTV